MKRFFSFKINFKPIAIALQLMLLTLFSLLIKCETHSRLYLPAKTNKYLQNQGEIISLYLGIDKKTLMSTDSSDFSFDFSFDKTLYLSSGYFECNDRSTCHLSNHGRHLRIFNSQTWKKREYTSTKNTATQTCSCSSGSFLWDTESSKKPTIPRIWTLITRSNMQNSTVIRCSAK